MRWVVFLVSCFLSVSAMGAPLSAAAASTHLCSAARATYVRCQADVRTSPGSLIPLATAKPAGYSPLDFKNAYGARGSTATTIGIVVAYKAPNLLKDLATYSRQFGLPAQTACKTAAQTGCLSITNQRGSTELPSASSDWAVETSMDTEIAHAMCPGCRLDVVEATSSSMANLGAAANEAAMLGASVISNSYGGAESKSELTYDKDYSHSRVTSVVSSGDDGYGVSYPAAASGVVAVGGTSLKMTGNRVVSEVAWNGAGSGCSAYEIKPSWQTDTHCSHRSVADVAADADPDTGAAVYDSYSNQGHAGWYTIGGTSLAAPLVAGLLAGSGNRSSFPAAFYGPNHLIRDITSGSNGSCSVSYLCRASSGYDGPTGMGVLSSL